MPNIAKVLKEEITRLSRKEAKAAVAPIRKPSLRLRRDVADLKKRMALIEKESKGLQAVLLKMEKAAPAPVPDQAERVRITGKGMRSLRRKLRISVLEFAKLLGVTGQAVYIWEQKQKGALKVRETTRAAILAVRDIGAREARQRLDAMKKAIKKAKKPAPRRRGRKQR